MADLSKLNFNADEVEITSGFKLCTAGWQKAVITDSSINNNKAGTGLVMMIEFCMVGGVNDSIMVKTWLNIQHSNETAQRIGQSDLAKITKSIGFKGTLNNSEQLHGKPLMVNVEHDEQHAKDSETGKLQYWKDASESEVTFTETPYKKTVTFARIQGGYKPCEDGVDNTVSSKKPW